MGVSGWVPELLKAPLLKLGGGGRGLSLPAAIRLGLFVASKGRLLPVIDRLLLCARADGLWANIDTESGWEGTEVRREEVDRIDEWETSSSFLDMYKALFEELLPALEVEWRRT